MISDKGCMHKRRSRVMNGIEGVTIASTVGWKYVYNEDSIIRDMRCGQMRSRLSLNRSHRSLRMFDTLMP